MTKHSDPALTMEQKVDRVYDAIGHLVTVTDRLVAEMGGMKERMASLEGEMGGLKAEMGGLKERMTGLEGEMGGLKDRVTKLEVRVDVGFQVVSARLDEQRQTINAMIPTRIAAVGRGDSP